MQFGRNGSVATGLFRTAQGSPVRELVRQLVHPLALLLWLRGGSVEVDMAPLTGESQPVVRSADAVRACWVDTRTTARTVCGPAAVT